MSHRLERIVLVLVVCVPVPAFALSGLTVPLPGIVERAAAALVPWADAPTLDTHALAASTTHGSIVLEPGTSVADVEPTGRRTPRVTARPRGARPAPSVAPAGVTVVRADRAEPETTRVPNAPEHHSDEEAAESPAPQPEEPTVEALPAPSDESGSEPPADPDVKPADDPAPVPKPRPTPRPNDEVDPLPPTNETDVPPADEPDVTPDPEEKPDEEKPVDEKPADEKPVDSGPPRRDDRSDVVDAGA